MEINSENDVIP